MIQNYKKNQKILCLIDILIVNFSFIWALYIRFGVCRYESFNIVWQMILTFVMVLIFYMFELYDYEEIIKPTNCIILCFCSSILVALSFIIIFYIFPATEYGRGIWGIQISLVFVLATIMRLSYMKTIRLIAKKKICYFLIGNNKDNMNDVDIIQTSFFEYKGFISTEYNEDNHISMRKISDVDSLIDCEGVSILVLLNNAKLSVAEERLLLNLKLSKKVRIFDYKTFYEKIREKVFVDEIDNFWVLITDFSAIPSNYYNKKIKRTLDIIFSLLLIPMFFPLAVIVSIAIKLTSCGSIIYKQVRTGYGDDFYIYKFRTMKVNSEKNGAVWAAQNDDRVTFIGRILRKTRMDELPQLINILKGDMTFVGPRPERPEFIATLKEQIPFYSLRHVVRPGLTGWAQVRYKYADSIEAAKEKLQYDLFYIKQQSFLLDLMILLKTVKKVFYHSGAR